MSVVFAKQSCVTEFAGEAVHVTAGEAWAADDPFVAAHPDWFGTPAGRRTSPPPAPADDEAPRIERGTRSPGEKRGPAGRPSARDL